MESKDFIRCNWCENDPEYINYHDNEWGIPKFDDNILFEALSLEIFQAGLSWMTILKKRNNLRKEFDNFDVKKVETYDKEKIISLYNNKKIIRHKLKIQSIISNAHYFRKIQKKYGSFSEYIWGFTNWKIKKNNFENLSDLPSKSDLSDKIYIDLKKNGFKFIGSVTIYSFLQAIGIIDNHLKSCYKY